MPLTINTFRNGGNYNQAPAIHTYTTPDTAAVMDTTGYFNGIAPQLRVGDVIMAVTSNGSPPGIPGWFFIRSITGTFPNQIVDVTDITAISLTNTD